MLLASFLTLAVGMAGCSFAEDVGADGVDGDGASDARRPPRGPASSAVNGTAECGDAAIKAANASLAYEGSLESFYSPSGLRVTLSAMPCAQPPGVRFETRLVVPDGVEVVATVTSSDGSASAGSGSINVTSIVRARAAGEYVLTGVAALVDDGGSNHGVIHSYAYLGIRGDAGAAETFQPSRPRSGSLLDDAAPDDAQTPPSEPANRTAPRLRVVAMGDTGTGPNASANVRGSIRDGAEAFIGLGDYHYSAPPETWFDVFAPLLGKAAYLAIGNHDVASKMAPWFENGTAWSLHLGGARIVALDTTESLAQAGYQYRWARAELCRAEEPLRILVMHAPWWLGPDAFHPSSKFPGNPRAMDDLVDDCGVDLVISAHEHNYQRYERGDARYLIVGTGGQSLYPVRGEPYGTVASFSENGRLILDIAPSGYEGMFRTLDGKTLDRFEGAAEP